MPTEVLFRNGEISVIDGFKVSLVRKGGLGSLQFAYPDFQQPYSNGRLYIWDIIQAEDIVRLHFGASSTFREVPAEENLIEAIFVPQAESQQDSSEYQKEPGVEPVVATTEESFPKRWASTKAPPPSPEFQNIKITRSENLDNYFPTYESMKANLNLPDAIEMERQSADAIMRIRNSASQQSYDISSDFVWSFANLGRKGVEAVSASEQVDLSICSQGFASSQTEEINKRNDATQTLAGRKAVSDGKDSSAPLPSRRAHVYSSCLKISLNHSASKESVSVKATEEHVTPSSDDGRTSAEARQEDCIPVTRQSLTASVRKEVTSDMKVSENSTTNQGEAPQHSTVDEGDFAGVVDGPTKNVKEIRAMFKGPDYVNYAKPKVLAKKPPVPSAKPKMRTEKLTSEPNRNSAEVAQQVIGLFKGALTLDDDVIATPPPRLAPTQNGIEEEDAETQTSVKDKVASFNNGVSPTKEREINNNEEADVAVHKKPADSVPCVELITNDHDKASGVKHEKVQAESYDESLDQFYNVLEELTAR